MKPKILAILPSINPSTIIGVITPLLDLHRDGQISVRVSLELTARESDVEWSDLIILCRNVDPLRSRWFLSLPKYDKPYIYDIDDNFFEIPLDMSLGGYYRAPQRLAMLREFIARANLVRVYSFPMLKRAEELNANVVSVTGPVDWRLLSPVRKTIGKNKVKIVYATSRVDDTLAEIFKPALKRILEKYLDRIEVYFLGYNPSEFKKYPNVFFRPLNINYRQYMRYFSRASFDIGLAPLLDDVFHRSKTNLKVREYGACRIAGIYSDVDVYSNSVISGQTGLLVQNDTDSWFNAISSLIEEQELRERIRENAYQFVFTNFSYTSFNKGWYEQIIQTLYQSFRGKENLNVLKNLIYPTESPSFSSGDLQGTMFSGKLKSEYNQTDMGLGRLWRRTSLHRKFITLISGLQSDGIDFLNNNLKMMVGTFWMMLKIRIALFFS